MDGSKADTPKETPSGLDTATEEEYASQSKLLQEFINISTIDNAWTFKSGNGMTNNVCNFFATFCATSFLHNANGSQ